MSIGNLKYTFLLGIIYLTACDKSYPDLYAPVGDNSFITEEIKEDLVPIMMGLTDPEYAIVTPKRNTKEGKKDGIFDSYEVDREEWLDARFNVFAFLSHNSIEPEYANFGFSNTSSVYTLLYNEPFKLSGETNDFSLVPADDPGKKFYYKQERQSCKYKFYTYYAGDAAEGRMLECDNNSTRILLPITLNGTQDILCGFAFHNDEEIAEIIKENTDGGDESKLLANYGQGLIYSTIAGHRGVQPKFYLKHLLTRFDLQVKGVKNKQGEENYKDVVVTGIKLETPTEGKMVVADDAWTKDNFEEIYKRGEILSFPDYTSANKSYIHAEIIPNVSDEVENQHPILKEGFQLYDTEPITVARSIVVPPRKEYSLILNYAYVHKDDNGNILGTTPMNYQASYSIKLQSDEPFKPGKQYTIQIYIYGPQEINIKIADVPEWETDGDNIFIEAGKDPDDNTEEEI